MQIPFSPPDITEVEIDEVVEALRSGWITTGPKTKELERELAEDLKTERVVLLNSATACLEMALRVLGIGEGDEVITSAYTYTASASVVAHVGAKLVLVDTAEDSLEMDYDALSRAITEKTRAIIPVDVAGVPCDYDRILAVAEKKRALFTPKNELGAALGRVAIVADAAHSLGAVYKGKPIGSVADMTSFSTHAVKNFTTAEGGALTWTIPTDHDALYHELMLLSLHGQSKDALAKTKLGAWEYDILMPGYKCNMTDVHAAIGLAQRRRYPALLNRRSDIVARYNEAFRGTRIRPLVHDRADRTSSHHLYITRIEGATDAMRRAVIEEMGARGIACNVHYKPLPLLTAYRKMGFEIADYPNAMRQYENEVTLPLHTLLTDAEVDYIIKNYKEVTEWIFAQA